MKILVTGASGMLGQAFFARFSSTHTLIGISKSGRNNTFSCDLARREAIDPFFKKSDLPDVVIHTAAYSDVDGCERDPQLAYDSNALAVKNLAQICALNKVPLAHVSTDYVFNGDSDRPYEITDKVFPVNVYGMSKLAGENFAEEYCPVTAIVRTSWLFGKASANTFVNAIIGKLKTEKVVRVLDDQEDSPTYALDLSEALEKISLRLVKIAREKSGARYHDIFQVCNSGSTTRYAMTVKMKEFLGLKDVLVEKADAKSIKNRLAIRPAYAAMSTKNYETTFNTTMRPWEDSLKEYIEREVL